MQMISSMAACTAITNGLPAPCSLRSLASFAATVEDLPALCSQQMQMQHGCLCAPTTIEPPAPCWVMDGRAILGTEGLLHLQLAHNLSCKYRLLLSHQC